MPNDFIFWSYFLKYYMLRNISAFFLMNKLATKILVCLQYFKVLANSIGRLKDKKDKRRIFGEGKASPSSQPIQIFPVARD